MVTTLSVIICTFDRYDLLDDAVRSLLDQSLADFEIIVVDNSPDQRRALEHGRRYNGHRNLSYVCEPKPGLSRARNIGCKRSQGKIVAFIDDDAIASPNWGREILRTFDEFPGSVGVVGGPTVPRWTAPRPEWLTDKLLKYLSVVDWGGEMHQLEPGEWLAGCNIAFRRTMLEEVGGFSELLGRSGPVALLSNEETEVVGLIKALGGLVVYNPKVSVEHTIDVRRLDEHWFYRRAAWQAVSDFISDADYARRHAHKVVERVSDFIDTSRSPQGTSDRVAAVYNLVLSSLAGEPIFGKDAGRRSGSRLSRNLKAIPRKAMKRIRSAFPP